MIRRLTVSFVVCLALAPSLRAQNLRQDLNQLFTFGTCGQPLCLDLGNAHGDHFLPSVTQGNNTVIAFVTEALGKSAANTPISSTSSGATYSIVGGLPVRTSTSAGPIFAERPQTLGRGRFFLGANVSVVHFTSLIGIPTDNLELNFSHQDVGNPGEGDPEFENDHIHLKLALDVNLQVASIFATWGITDFADIGVALPIERVTLNGTSQAEIVPFGASTPHYFGGTAANPVLSAASSVNSSASGIGDVVGRLKINLGQSRRFGAALLGEVRFPTGDENNLLGSGATSVRGLGIFGAQFGTFAVHANGGYLARTGKLQNDAIQATLGFDNLMASWATLAFSLISEWQVGASKLTLPPPIHYQFPFVRTLESSSIPDRRENRLDAALGIKFNVRGGTVLMIDGIAPLRRAGMQPDYIFTTGLEFSF